MSALLGARTPCCLKKVTVRNPKAGKRFDVTCTHFPQGRTMEIKERDGQLYCWWEENGHA